MRLYRQECVVVVSARVIKRAESAELKDRRLAGARLGFGLRAAAFCLRAAT